MRKPIGRNVVPGFIAWLGCLIVGAACEGLAGLDWRPRDGRGRFLASTLLDTLGHPMPATPPEGSNTILVLSPLDGHFAGWSKDSWGGALQLQLGDRVKTGDNLALLQTDEGVIEAVASPKNGTIVAMLSLDINSQVDPGMPLVLLEPRISSELEAGAPQSSKTSPARTEQPVSSIGSQVAGTGSNPQSDDTDNHRLPVWAWPLSFIVVFVLFAVCIAKFCQFVSFDKPCSSTQEGDYQLAADEIEQDPLMAGIQRSARDSEPSTPRPGYAEAGLPIEFATKADASQVIHVTHKPLGMLFFKSWWKNGLKVAGFKEPSHAQQLGVQVGWVITKVGSHSVVGLQYKEASEILRLAVDDLPELDGHGLDDEDAHSAGSPPQSFQRLPIEQARQMPQPPTDSEESRQTLRPELAERAMPAVASGGGLMLTSQDSETSERSATQQQSELSTARPLFSDPRPLQAGPCPSSGSKVEEAVAAALGGSFRPDPGLRPGESEVSGSFPLLDAHRGSGTPEESQVPSQAAARIGFEAVEEEESMSPGSRVPRGELTLEFVTTYNKKQVVTITHRPLGMTFYKSFWKKGLKVAGFKKTSHARDRGVQPSWIITKAGDVDLTSMKYKEASRELKAAVAHLPLMEGAESEGEDSSSSRDSSREGSPDPAGGYSRPPLR